MVTSVPENSVSKFSQRWLFAAGWLCVAGALVHLAIPIGGPDWYNFFGAPPALAAMAEAGLARPVITVLAISAALFAIAAYAFSALGSLRPLPAIRPVLAIVGIGLLVRGLSFPLIASVAPEQLGRVCGRCDGLNAFVMLTSALCLFIGIGYLLGAWHRGARN